MRPRVQSSWHMQVLSKSPFFPLSCPSLVLLLYLSFSFISLNYHFLLTLYSIDRRQWWFSYNFPIMITLVLCCFVLVTFGPWFGSWWPQVTILWKPQHFGSWLFSHLWINTESFLYLFFQLSFAIWCLVWLHLCLLNDLRQRLSLHMGRRRGLCLISSICSFIHILWFL